MKPGSVSRHLVGAFAMTPEIEARFQLAMGRHPISQQNMTEAEERTALSILRWIDRAQLLDSKADDPNIEICRLWVRYYPELPELMRLRSDEFYEALWRAVLKDAIPVAMGTIVNCTPCHGISRVFSNNPSFPSFAGPPSRISVLGASLGRESGLLPRLRRLASDCAC